MELVVGGETLLLRVTVSIHPVLNLEALIRRRIAEGLPSALTRTELATVQVFS